MRYDESYVQGLKDENKRLREFVDRVAQEKCECVKGVQICVGCQAKALQEKEVGINAPFPHRYNEHDELIDDIERDNGMRDREEKEVCECKDPLGNHYKDGRCCTCGKPIKENE